MLPFEIHDGTPQPPEIFAGPDEVKTAPNELFTVGSSRPTEAQFHARIESNGGGETEYAFGYSRSETGPFTSCASGSVGASAEFVDAEGGCGGLSPETSYYGRLTAKNKYGEASEIRQFTTASARPWWPAEWTCVT